MRSLAAAASRRLLAGGLALAAAAAPLAAATEVNRVVLRVNDRIATLVDYQERLADRLRALERADIPAADRQQLLGEAPGTVMREIFDELLLLSRADQLDVQISPEQIEAAVQQTREEFGIESEEEFELALAQSGLTREALRQRMRTTLRLQEVVGREVHGRIEIAEEDLRRYYREHPEEFQIPERVRLREVVVLERDQPRPEEMAAIAAELRREVAAGRALEQAVEAIGERGGLSPVIDLGWVALSDLDPALEAAVHDLEAGEFSEPVAGRGGLHLIELLEREPARPRPFTEVQDLLRRRERERRFQETFAGYIRELEGDAFVEAEPPPEAAGFRRAEAMAPEPLAEPQAEPGAEPARPAEPPAVAPEPPAEPPAADPADQPVPGA